MGLTPSLLGGISMAGRKLAIVLPKTGFRNHMDRSGSNQRGFSDLNRPSNCCNQPDQGSPQNASGC